MVFVLIGISAHPVWLGLILSYVFGYQLHMFPLGGLLRLLLRRRERRLRRAAPWAYHLVLPWFTFAMLFAALYARMIRASVLETIDEDYVRTARAKGACECACPAQARAPERVPAGGDDARDGHRHRLRRPVIFIETVFGLPGHREARGARALQRAGPAGDHGDHRARDGRDLIFNLVVDLLYALARPAHRDLARGLRRQGRAELPEGARAVASMHRDGSDGLSQCAHACS